MLLIVSVTSWIGTALLCAAPFLIDSPEGKGAAILGLALLCHQAFVKKCYNLIVLNFIGIIGYASHFYF